MKILMLVIGIEIMIFEIVIQFLIIVVQFLMIEIVIQLLYDAVREEPGVCN
nr:hypothetical protein Q903MT_gene1103 [Picea sitchensis]